MYQGRVTKLRASSADAITQVRGVRRLANGRQLEPRPFRTEALEQPRPAAEQHRRDVELELFDEAGGERLVDRVGAACDQHVELGGRCAARPLDGRRDAVGDERERRLAEYEWLTLVVRDDEDRLVERRLVAPPAGSVRV